MTARASVMTVLVECPCCKGRGTLLVHEPGCQAVANFVMMPDGVHCCGFCNAAIVPCCHCSQHGGTVPAEVDRDHCRV